MNFCSKCGSGVIVLTLDNKTIQVCSAASFNIVKEVFNSKDGVSIGEIKKNELEGHFYKEGL